MTPQEGLELFLLASRYTTLVVSKSKRISKLDILYM